MNDEEYLHTYDVVIIKLTEEEHSYLAERGFDHDLADLVDVLEPSTGQLVLHESCEEEMSSPDDSYAKMRAQVVQKLQIFRGIANTLT